MVRSPLNTLEFRRAWSATVVLLLCALVAGPAAALTSRPHLIHSYTAEDGLPSSGVYSLDQGPDGRMWFVTRDEAAVFDGFVWQTWSARKDLPPRHLSRIRVGSSGNVRALTPRYNSTLETWDGTGWRLLDGPALEGPEYLDVSDFAVI
jgi:hypothetical protein